MFSVQSKSRLNVLSLVLLRVAFTAALTLGFTGIVGNHAEAARSKPDLIVSAVSAPSSASPGETIVVSGTIKNQGRASSNAFSVAAYLSASPSNTTGATLLGAQNISSLAAGASVTLVGSLAMPGTTMNGTFYIVAVADSTKVISESNESNNIRASGAIAVQDSTPPSISAVNVTGITANNATIVWSTNEAGTSQVEYGTTATYGNSTSFNSSLVTNHGAGLSSLVAGTLYHFRVRSKDAAGNEALSGDNTFTTSNNATAGNTYYVATNGSDANPGAEALPFRTISHGVSVLTPGDTLLIRSGVYAESVYGVPSGTSWSAPVTVAAYPGETVTLRPGANGWPIIYTDSKSYIVFDKLILDGADHDATVINVFLDGTSHHIRIQNSEITNSPRSGAYVNYYAHDNEFVNVNVHNNGWNTAYNGHGIYLEGSSNLVEKSTISQNAYYGVHIYSDSYHPSDNIVRNNTIHDNDARGSHNGAGVILSSGSGNMAYNNLIWGNTGGGIRIAYGTPTDSEVYNNTVYNNAEYGIRIDSDAVNSIIENNILSQNGTAYSGGQFSNVGTGTQSSKNLIGSDPKFVDPLAHDFHLQPGSSAIDQGVLIDVVTTDFDGTARPQGFALDLGAMEFIN